MASAADIKVLRERTGAGMLDCKKALEANGGDIEKAIDWLREKGIAKAAKKSGRIAAEGLVFGGELDNLGVIIEFNSETDFVAKNDDFKNFGTKLVELALKNKTATVEDLKAVEVDGSTVDNQLTELIAKIGENLNIRRLVLVEAKGFVVNYIHLGGKIGVLVEVEGENTPENHEKAKGVAMHIAAMDPSYLNREQVTASDLEKEREIARVQLLEEGKPEAIVEKILEGKMRKFYEENCLLEQKYVRDDKVSIKEFIAPSSVVGFARYKVGEGIEKVETDFAAEVAAQIANTK
ncbi:translation elongation factor Ts [Streptobacillus moniliformis]|uniref:Elongation factor Ts n=1 Tax=Streptobacillus moniliformis (strain ATCC 14647 / DSM 12112 / NCTC 10651 / 9901) TaxID=519441 RepID=D1AWM4_STRM9|nr:translation elongation factor Ts [Streptobacillus moniliformis]ACZ00700.1 translation elongation factor Ts [Streptobacillus moniliformis DSM 12112]AVL42901.1 elongation factor Ts [Streptobacillus moniliformis]QXW65459.1 translation elongation factor Ts [Streptobacillus moniliformis]SQA14172.1 Elongation factor Ts [Streptobacillus moniliformis]